MDDTYNGYSNYETWNVALWIQNDEGLYELARRARDYKAFIKSLREFEGPISKETPDGVAWNDSCIDTEELDELIMEG